MQDYIGNIRSAYTKDFTSKDITKQQIAVATYLIDKLALRAGNEKVLCWYMHLETLICCNCKLPSSPKHRYVYKMSRLRHTNTYFVRKVIFLFLSIALLSTC